MSARNRTIEFVDYITRRYSAWDLGYDTYSALVVAVYEGVTTQGQRGRTGSMEPVDKKEVTNS